ncbi:uncharacterized protein LOC123690570 [Pieris rapae]|uniref:uncharacterized protein LOC123690570 n=1 Tax=Pieris rapae TaxID=64459 RepID=UPI001E2815F8|nr:uncharacterized protein LOC123690570 [Pieris rapae]
MFIKIIMLLWLLKIKRASIAGVTYMDDFDFEQRYRNLHECDPFYWHPLHLPEECADMFAKLIRSRIKTPYRIVTEKEPFIASERFYNSHFDYNTLPVVDDTLPVDYGIVYPMETVQLYKRPRNPMDKLLDMLKRDVHNIPSAARIASIPYFGGVALYKQPVSWKTEAMIKQLSQAYAKAAYNK